MKNRFDKINKQIMSEVESKAKLINEALSNIAREKEKIAEAKKLKKDLELSK